MDVDNVDVKNHTEVLFIQELRDRRSRCGHERCNLPGPGTQSPDVPHVGGAPLKVVKLTVC